LKAQSQFQFQLNTNLSMKDVAPGIKIRETGGLASIMGGASDHAAPPQFSLDAAKEYMHKSCFQRQT